MPGKKWLMGALLGALLVSTGCCGFCDRWCSGHHSAGAAPAPCCVPCQSYAAPVQQIVPQAGWNQPAATCPPGCRPG